MKVLIAFLLICFVGATLLHKRTLKTSAFLLVGLVLLVSIGYFFFNQI
jgi:hypothetical protein